ncbi:MAG: hypothetical protein AAF462_06910 [Thermodesulfobacteriota bacterium]
MTGLIWMVQIVHYPLFKYVGNEQFLEYERKHSKLITFIVGPVMSLELLTGIVILSSSFLSNTDYNIYLISFGLLVLIWLSTAFVQVRHHKQLSTEFSTQVVDKLVGYNWIRTICWTIRAILLAFILYDLL